MPSQRLFWQAINNSDMSVQPKLSKQVLVIFSRLGARVTQIVDISGAVRWEDQDVWPSTYVYMERDWRKSGVRWFASVGRQERK